MGAGPVSFVSDRYGNVNSAVYLGQGYLNMGNGYVNPIIAKSGSFWVLCETYGYMYALNMDNDYFNIRFEGSHTLKFYLSFEQISYDFVYWVGTWFHIGFSQTRDRKCNLYVNATLVSSAACTIPGYETNGTNYIGYKYQSYSFNGYIDDFVLYNYYMSEADMLVMMNYNF